MTSYLKLYQDFLQQKEIDIKGISASDEEEDECNIGADNPTSSVDPPLGATHSFVPGTANTTGVKMENPYMRDKSRPLTELTTGLTPARTILVSRPPQNVACHTYSMEEHDMEECNQAQIPAYNEIAAKEAMNECGRIAKYVKNNNSDEEDWEAKVDKRQWSNLQKTLFAKVARILDNDQLGFLSNVGRQNEAMQRRVIVDKSASRMRRALASVAWDGRITQWLHCLLLDTLPATYMASYLDILQTLKSKLPTLMDKMLFGRPINVSQELLAPVMKKKWEPVIVNTKVRNLAQNAVIVALPSMPTSGPVPKRLQKWYQHLATITQIVQITLPITTGHAARQPLEQVAEQIVSVTRVKIQDLRSEDPTRSIILIGFNAGAALALQVAMSENIACVVCMGFAYNTFNGPRGAPDDRILDIKVPILFVIGQNSARTSAEEIESLRERMQSETSLVVVGSADDVLRVPKSRHKIDNVTQNMVDMMVVDELYDFVQRTLTNPPGPRIPTAITNTVYTNKSTKSIALSGSGGTTSSVVQPRKRKIDGALEGASEQTPAKIKNVPHIGRPRTRPLPVSSISNSTATVVKSGTPTIQMGTSTTPFGGKLMQKTHHLSANSITNEDLNMAIKSILSDSSDMPDPPSTSKASGIAGGSGRIVTNFDLVPQSKVMPIKTSVINPLHKATPISGSKIKMIPANQFVQLKPPNQSQSKIYTIKPSQVNIGNVVTPAATTTASGQQQQIFTLKAPNGQTTQFVTASPSTTQQKYTVIKNASGGTTLTLSAAKPSVSIGSSGGGGTSATQMDLSNIIDMPIVFADGEGNISESVVPSGSDSMKTTQLSAGGSKSGGASNVGQLIISQKIIKEANTSTPSIMTGKNTYVIGKTGGLLHTPTPPGQTPQISKPNNVVFINRTAMKPCPNIISRPAAGYPFPKYTKVVVTNAKNAANPTLLSRGSTAVTPAMSSVPLIPTVKHVNLQPVNASTLGRQSGVINMATKSFQIINAGTGPNSDKPQIRNIMVKPGGLKQIPPQLKTQLLNRNLTVRKLNIVPTTIGSSAMLGTGIGTNSSETTAAGSSSSSMPNTIQSTPKIITLNPINRVVTNSTFLKKE